MNELDPVWPNQQTATLAGLVAIATMLGVLIGYLLPRPPLAPLDESLLPSGWRQVEWPLSRDQFGPGVALECLGVGCGSLMRVTVRPKIGFCNCVTGVADDEELSRIGDVTLFSDQYRPDLPGESFTVGGLPGRLRSFVADEHAPLLSIAYSSHCDAVVATVQGFETTSRAAIRNLLESPAVARWTRARINL